MLLHTTPISYKDCRTVNGILYPTFQQAALERNLVTDVNDALICFQQSLGLATPHELRSLFSILTINGFPTLIIYNNELMRKELMLDWLNEGINLNQANNNLLKDIQHRLSLEDKTPEMYGFKSPPRQDTELEREKNLYDPFLEAQKLEHLETQYENNIDQKRLFDTIISAVDLGKKDFFFIDGPGGTGKTTVIKKIVTKLRAEGKIVQICASTTLAATLYENAMTAHSLFKFPVEDDDQKDSEERTCCKLENTERLELLQNTHVIIWDEFVSNNKDLFEAVQRELHMCKNLIFICAGDFRQILPVVKKGSEPECIAACISSSIYWPQFKILRLKINMRLSLNTFNVDLNAPNFIKQKEYADSILAIGEGRNHNHAIILNTDSTGSIFKVGLPMMKYFLDDQIEFALSWLYPNGFNIHDMQKTCILSSTNSSVDSWNEIIQKINPEQQIYHLPSHDYLCDVDDPFGYLACCLNEDVLNTFNANGVPKHILKLKINDICIVTRSLKSGNISTNSRVRIIAISSHVIKAELLSDSNRIVLIPKIRFKFKLDYGESYQMMRCQFPLRLAYCMTYNKSQSQTFTRILLDVINEPFTHGHLYVAMSRITNCENIRLLITKDQLHCNPYCEFEEMPIITNVVFHSVLLS